VGKGVVRVSSQVAGGDMRMRGRGVVGPCVGRPWKCPPHSSFAFALIALALMRAAWLPFATPVLVTTYVDVVPRWRWGCPATHLRACGAVPSLYSPFSERPCATGFAAWGSRGGRTRGGAVRAFPIARMRQPSTATAHDYRCGCGCIVRWRDRGEGPMRRARWPAQCGAVDGEMYVETGGNVGGQGSVMCIQLWGGCGVECAAVHGAMCLRATEGGGWRCWSTWQCHGPRCESARRRCARRKRALTRSWTVGMREWGDVWVTSDAPGETSDGWDGRVARGWARALGVIVEAVEVRLRARLQLPQGGNVSSPVRTRVRRRKSGSERITRMGQYPRHLGEA
jgi:hypothetical protein